MQNQERLSNDDAKGLLTYLLNVENLVVLESIKNKILSKDICDDRNQHRFELEIGDHKGGIEPLLRDGLAQEVFDLAKDRTISLGRGRLAILGSGINDTLIEIDLNECLDRQFNDALKLVDMLATDNLPTQVEAYYRTYGEIKTQNVHSEGSITLSDDASLLLVNRSDGTLRFENLEFEASEQAVAQLSRLNAVYRRAQEHRSEYSRDENLGAGAPSAL